MPYKIKGKEVLHFKNGKWSLKQTAHSHQKAINTVKLLQGLEHGWHPDVSKNRKIVDNIIGKKKKGNYRNDTWNGYEDENVSYPEDQYRF